MPTLDVQVDVDRTSLALATLTMNESTGYYIARDGMGPGAQMWRKNYAQSVYVPGQYLTHAVKDQQNMLMQVRVKGTSESDMTTKLEDMIVAFEQFNYEITITIGTTTITYECDPADVTIGADGNFQDLWWRSNTQMVSLDIPHKPILSGVLD